MTTPITPLFAPPPQGTPITDPTWSRWFYALWGTVGQGLDASGPQGTFPKLRVDKATFSNANMVQELLTMNKGLYSNYSSTANGILYCFAGNVHRAQGTNFVVAAQLNAWAERGVTCPVFGLATTALAQPGSVNCSLVAFEPDVANLDDNNQRTKQGMNPVFKDRGDGAATAGNGLGNNLYNYYSIGLNFSSQGRSASGEYCGWNVGIDFGDYWGDQSSVLAWSGAVSYTAGMIVSSGGVLWRAITNSLNQLPAGGSAYWVQRTGAGIVNLCVGIDFSTMSIGAMARMASAIRLRSTQFIHFEETGQVGIKFDPGTGRLIFDNNGNVRMAIDMTNGTLDLGTAAIALGGGAAATLGTIGGSGPTVAAQNKWLSLKDSAGTTYFIPAWV